MQRSEEVLNELRHLHVNYEGGPFVNLPNEAPGLGTIRDAGWTYIQEFKSRINTLTLELQHFTNANLELNGLREYDKN